MGVTPIRVKGLHGYSGDPLMLWHVPSAGYQISYTSPTGELWRLSAPTVAEELEQRAILVEGGWKGGVGQPEFAEHEAVNRFGVRRAGYKVPKLSGSIDVALRSVPENLTQTLWAWRQSWSFFDPGVLRVVARDGANRWTPVVLDGFSDPERSPSGLSMMQETVSWVSLLGHWFDKPVWFTGADAIVAVTGDMRPSCKLVWDTEASPTASVGFPSGQQFTLIAAEGATGKRFINLDRGMAGQVTREDGSVDVAMWASFQGRVLGVELEPHKQSVWQLEGVELEVTPRYLSPWG